MHKKYNKIYKIISNSLSIPISALNEKSSNKNISQWDSIGHIRIMLEIEKSFRKIKTSEIQDMTSVKKIIRILSKKK